MSLSYKLYCDRFSCVTRTEMWAPFGVYRIPKYGSAYTAGNIVRLLSYGGQFKATSSYNSNEMCNVADIDLMQDFSEIS
jgi:hypothetical protein